MKVCLACADHRLRVGPNAFSHRVCLGSKADKLYVNAARPLRVMAQTKTGALECAPRLVRVLKLYAGIGLSFRSIVLA
jgi:hypothetical protein